MAGIDKIYGTKKQHAELKAWLLENEKPIRCNVGWRYQNGKSKNTYAMCLPSNYLYDISEWENEKGPISNFPSAIDRWLIDNCPLKWGTNYIKKQYGLTRI